MIVELIHDLFIILAAGWISGLVSRRLGLSMLVGYLLAGAAFGHGGLGLIAEDSEEIEHIACAAALLLLFAIGIEFSLEDLARLSRYFFVGGSIQMLLVVVPVGLACILFGVFWKSALLIAAATALSSTVLVYRLCPARLSYGLGRWTRRGGTRTGRRTVRTDRRCLRSRRPDRRANRQDASHRVPTMFRRRALPLPSH